MRTNTSRCPPLDATLPSRTTEKTIHFASAPAHATRSQRSIISARRRSMGHRISARQSIRAIRSSAIVPNGRIVGVYGLAKSQSVLVRLPRLPGVSRRNRDDNAQILGGVLGSDFRGSIF